MVPSRAVACDNLVVLTPLIHTADRNVVRISRVRDLESSSLYYVAGGEHTGIVINRLCNLEPDSNCDVTLNFFVWLNDGATRKRENRYLRFRFVNEVDCVEQHRIAQEFFKDLVVTFPKDYVNLLKRMLKQMQNGFDELKEIEIDMQLAKEDDAYQMPDLRDYGADEGSEIEKVSVAHVQDVLEHAYPNGISVEIIAHSLRCTVEEIEMYLEELELSGIAQKVQNEWIRTASANLDPGKTISMNKASPPTVAIITCLFTEKQSVDAIMDDCATLHRYRSGGESNVYTTGYIGKHRVVATKLAVIGDSREATTSAGSITTRLLGNFQHVEHVFIIGVGGGIAHFTDPEQHVRLGDVVVSSPHPDSYVFAHTYKLDRATEAIDGFITRKWAPKDQIIGDIVSNADEKMITEWNEITDAAIEKLNSSNPDLNFSRPSPEDDLLALPVGEGQVVVVPHSNQERNKSALHVGAIGGMVTCRLSPTHDDQIGEDPKDLTSQLRDRFAAEHQLRAIDAGFDSVIAAIVGSRIDSWALIRGITDYQHGQSRKSRLWQPYAGVRAASLAKCIINRLSLDDR